MRKYICSKCFLKQKIKDQMIKVSFGENDKEIFWGPCARCKKEQMVKPAKAL